MFRYMKNNLYLCIIHTVILITEELQFTAENLSNAGIKNMFEIPNWPTHSPVWQLDYKTTLLDGVINEPIQTRLEEIEKQSDSFPIDFPIDTGRCKILKNNVSVEVLERNINSVYPVLSENVLPLFVSFILHKRKFGNEEERKLYANMSLITLVDRLLLKRAVSFIGADDSYIFLDGRRGNGIENLSLQECLSYDEIKLSSFLSVSSYSYFINDGNRHNLGVPTRTSVEEEGIVIGLIGTRLEKPNVMEYQEIVISKEQNHEGNGYGTTFAPTMRSIFAGFYGEVAFTYRNVEYLLKEQPNRFVEIEAGVVFDKVMYCKRLTLSFDTLLHEANDRAKEKNTTAFVHVVGIGLGVWKLTSIQNALFLDTFAKRIQILDDNLHSVTDVVFSYFGNNRTSDGFKDGEIIPIPSHPKGGIRIYFAQRQPHTKLTGDHQGKLLIVSYAWDGNALPGNDFWKGSLDGSGDSAQASSSQITEIHNPHINPQVCAANLKIATQNGLVSFRSYRDGVSAIKD